MLPQLEKFWSRRKRNDYRRVRAGVVTAAIGLGGALLIFLLSLQLSRPDSIYRSRRHHLSDWPGIGTQRSRVYYPAQNSHRPLREAKAQAELESLLQNSQAANQLSAQPTNDLPSDLPRPANRLVARPSVTEHTTHQLKPNKT